MLSFWLRRGRSWPPRTGAFPFAADFVRSHPHRSHPVALLVATHARAAARAFEPCGRLVESAVSLGGRPSPNWFTIARPPGLRDGREAARLQQPQRRSQVVRQRSAKSLCLRPVLSANSLHSTCDAHLQTRAHPAESGWYMGIRGRLPTILPTGRRGWLCLCGISLGLTGATSSHQTPLGTTARVT